MTDLYSIMLLWNSIMFLSLGIVCFLLLLRGMRRIEIWLVLIYAIIQLNSIVALVILKFNRVLGAIYHWKVPPLVNLTFDVVGEICFMAAAWIFFARIVKNG